MAGVEVISAFAVATQFAAHGLQIVIFISDLYSKVRDVPESIRKQSGQLEQLIGITKLIARNPLLQTELVESILQTCVGEVRELQQILANISTAAGDGAVRKVWKALDGITKEERILALFSNLEREKSSLALCVEAIDS